MTNDSSPIVSLSELLPCPFCGGVDINSEGPCYDQFMCNGCGAATYEQPSHAEAITAWNTRASRPAEGEVEPVGHVGEMPGSNGGFTMAVFKADDVPLGAPLYTHPTKPVAPLPAGEWVMAPREPTEDMVRAGFAALNPLDIYRIMISAAPTRPISPAHGVKELEWRLITAALVKETERMCGHGPMLNAVRSCLTTPADSGSAEVTEDMVFAAMRRADELGEVLDDIDAREILTAALNNGRS